MTDRAALTAAIAAHGAWKRRLAAAITSGTDVSTPDRVRVDNACDFGKWLYGADLATRTDPHYAEIKDLHAQFHRAAADVLAMALAGRKTDAQKATTPGSTFASISGQLTTRMMAWNEVVAR